MPHESSRLAADVLDRYLGELTGEGALSGMAVPLDQEGLSSASHSLDASLSELQVSPFPALVIGVEGETEELLLPRVSSCWMSSWIATGYASSNTAAPREICRSWPATPPSRYWATILVTMWISIVRSPGFWLWLTLKIGT